jgi:hypothetical protein
MLGQEYSFRVSLWRGVGLLTACIVAAALWTLPVRAQDGDPGNGSRNNNVSQGQITERDKQADKQDRHPNRQERDRNDNQRTLGHQPAGPQNNQQPRGFERPNQPPAGARRFEPVGNQPASDRNQWRKPQPMPIPEVGNVPAPGDRIDPDRVRRDLPVRNRVQRPPAPQPEIEQPLPPPQYRRGNERDNLRSQNPPSVNRSWHPADPPVQVTEPSQPERPRRIQVGANPFSPPDSEEGVAPRKGPGGQNDNYNTGRHAPPTGMWRKAQPTPKTQVDQTRDNSWINNTRQRIRQENPRTKNEIKVPKDRLFLHRPDGNRIDALVMDREYNPVTSGVYNMIRRSFGNPNHGFTYIPRPVASFSVGYRHGDNDGRRNGRDDYHGGIHYGTKHHNHRPVFMFFYSNFYFDDPYYSGFWYNGYYPTIYTYYGWMPRWCRPASVIVYNSDPYPYYVNARPTYYLYNDTRAPQPTLDENGVYRAMADLRQSWLDGDIDRLGFHVRDAEKISVYFDNDYSYSLSGEDYYSMTLDAMTTIKTIGMDFDDPTWLSSNEVFFTGRHVFIDPDDGRQTAYVSYRLHRYSGRWYIIGVGSSPQPIGNNFVDFRYRNN